MTLFGKKPRSLCEVVRRAKSGEQSFDPALREFLDVFYADPALRQQAIDDRPAGIDAVHDAYVAAVAEHWPGRTDCKSRNGARFTATIFTNHFLQAVFSR